MTETENPVSGSDEDAELDDVDDADFESSEMPPEVKKKVRASSLLGGISLLGAGAAFYFTDMFLLGAGFVVVWAILFTYGVFSYTMYRMNKMMPTN